MCEIWSVKSILSKTVLLLHVGLQAGCVFFHGQRFHDFSIPMPVADRQVLVIGFMGGRVAWDSPREGVRRLALKLRSQALPVSVETVENKKRDLARQLLTQCFDKNSDGRLGDPEKRTVRLILYGQSFGGAAVVKFARQLYREGIPVLLTIQIDSVGLGDGLIPPNVGKAANLFQRNGLFVRGQSRIRAQDPSTTEIVANLEFDYRHRKIDLSGVHFFKKIFRQAHTKMNLDPEVWSKVEELIVGEVLRGG